MSLCKGIGCGEFFKKRTKETKLCDKCYTKARCGKRGERQKMLKRR